MLVKHSLLYLPAQIIGPLAQLVAAVVWTHWISPALYGQLTFVMAAQDLVFLLCLSWWSQFTVRRLSGQSGAADACYRKAEGVVLAIATLAQAGATLLALAFLSTPITPMLALASIAYAVTRSLGLHLGERARAQSRIFAYTVAQTIGPLIGFAIAFFLVSRIAATPEAALFGYSVAQVGAVIWLARDLGVSLRLSRPNRALILSALRFGLPLVAAGAAAWIGANAIRVIVDHVDGSAAMGLMAVGWGLGQRLTTTVAMFVTVAAFPLAMRDFARGSRDSGFDVITGNGVAMLALVLPAAVGFVLVSEPLLRLFVAAPFQATTLGILPYAAAAGVARNIRGHIADQILILIDATGLVLLINGLEALAVVTGGVVGVTTGGPVGAAAGCCVGYTIVLVLGFAVVRWKTDLRLPYFAAGGVLLATAVMALALILPAWARLAGDDSLELALETGCGGIVYGIALLVFFPKFRRVTVAFARRFSFWQAHLF